VTGADDRRLSDDISLEADHFDFRLPQPSLMRVPKVACIEASGATPVGKPYGPKSARGVVGSDQSLTRHLGARIHPHRREIPLYPARRLADAVFILNKRNADETFTFLAEASARGDGDTGVGDQLL
jgi:hypothetical protein